MHPKTLPRTTIRQRNLFSQPSTIFLWYTSRRGYNISTNDDNASNGNHIRRNGEVEMGKGTSRGVFVALLRKQ